MNREIKFRAWNKESKCWVWIPDMAGVQEITDKGKQIFMQFIGKEYCEIMQYTGLKDKNGVEIYEGDIIGFLDKRKKQIMVVKYDKYYCEEYGDYIGFNINENMEVIGNIYENPELLGEKEE